MNIISRIKKNWRWEMLLVLALLFSCYPYVFNKMLNLGNETILMSFFLFIFSTLVFTSKRKPILPHFFKVCLFIQILTWVMYSIIHYDSSYLSRIVIIILAVFSLVVLISGKNLFKFADNYNKIICFMAVGGVPVFFLFALGFLQPIMSFPNLDGRMCYFFGLTCSNSITSGICRVAGFFDEPGALAFWGIIALITNRLFFKNTKVEVLLIISLLPTLSAAYFVQLFLYIIFFYHNKTKHLIIISLLLGVIGFLVYKGIGDNVQLAYLTTERFEGGQIRSSRIDMTKRTKLQFEQSPLLGVGAKELQERGYFDDNPYEIPAKDGLIGFFVTYLPLFVAMLKYGKHNKDFAFACVILFAGYMQRPFHINILHFFIFYQFVLLAYYKYQRRINYV